MFRFYQGAFPDQSSWISPFTDIHIAKQASHILFLKTPSWASPTSQPQASENVRTSSKKSPETRNVLFVREAELDFCLRDRIRNVDQYQARLWDVKWLPELLLPRENVISMWRKVEKGGENSICNLKLSSSSLNIPRPVETTCLFIYYIQRTQYRGYVRKALK